MWSLRRRRDWLLPAAAVASAAVVGFGVRGMWPRQGSAGILQNAPGAVVTARVIRTDVAQRQDVAGTIGYQGSYSVLNELPAGIITWTPARGRVIRRGQVAYRLAAVPVTLFYGAVPAWRDIGPGMTPGADVRELDRNLRALGFDPAHQIQPGDTFGWPAQAAIERWQRAHDLPLTGTIPLGQAVFLPGPLRVASAVAAGTPVSPGTTAVSGTSTTTSVLVNLTPGGAAVRPGDGVLITLPDGSTVTGGTVTSVAPVTTVQAPAGQDQAGVQATAPAAAIPVTIRPGQGAEAASYDQAQVQVTITEAEHKHVLAVPVTALLAVPGGGYAVRTASGRRLIAVSTGLYDEVTGLIEVSGPGLAPGLTVQVAQP